MTSQMAQEVWHDPLRDCSSRISMSFIPWKGLEISGVKGGGGGGGRGENLKKA